MVDFFLLKTRNLLVEGLLVDKIADQLDQIFDAAVVTLIFAYAELLVALFAVFSLLAILYVLLQLEFVELLAAPKWTVVRFHLAFNIDVPLDLFEL